MKVTYVLLAATILTQSPVFAATHVSHEYECAVEGRKQTDAPESFSLVLTTRGADELEADLVVFGDITTSITYVTARSPETMYDPGRRESFKMYRLKPNTFAGSILYANRNQVLTVAEGMVTGRNEIFSGRQGYPNVQTYVTLYRTSGERSPFTGYACKPIK